MAVKIFFCYAREDEMLLNKLKAHLRALERQHEIEMWHDRDISAGKVWSREIDTYLGSAQIILLLVSPDFIASDYCYSIEMKRAMGRHERGEARVIPIILRHTHWQETPLGELQALPRDGCPVTDSSCWKSLDEALLDAVKGIQKVVLELSTTPLLKTQSFQHMDALLDTILSTRMEDTSRHPSEARIATPSLVILLGSTAGLVGLELMRHMLSLKPRDKRRIALIYLDIDEPSGTLLAFRRQHQNTFQEFLLRVAVPMGISQVSMVQQSDEEVQDLQKGTLRHLNFKEQHTFIKDKVPQYFANGAGGIRNNGHVAACFNFQYILDVLERAIVTITRLGVNQDAVKVQEVQANIVAFMGGGTGSGTMADIAIMVRDLLANTLYKQRLNLFCLLPESSNGVNPNDLKWRKSNATAGLLEILAYSRVATNNPSEEYKKYMRAKAYRLTNDPIANEVYLIRYSSMADTGDTARIVGLDLFQRITDASGVGSLERRTWIDRRILHVADDQGLPRMFGTSCPLELCFPAEEIASAFARISASRFLLRLLTNPSIKTDSTTGDQDEWSRKWRDIVNFKGTDDPNSVKPAQYHRRDFEYVSQTSLDRLWLMSERRERVVEAKIREILQLRVLEERHRIQANVSQHRRYRQNKPQSAHPEPPPSAR